MLYKIAVHCPFVWPSLHERDINVKPMFVLCKRDDGSLVAKVGMIQLPSGNSHDQALINAWAKMVMKWGKEMPLRMAQSIFFDHHIVAQEYRHGRE